MYHMRDGFEMERVWFEKVNILVFNVYLYDCYLKMWNINLINKQYLFRYTKFVRQLKKNGDIFD